MRRDRKGAILSLFGMILCLTGFAIVIDLGYYHNLPVLSTIPAVGLVAPNLIVGGFGLVELGRYYGTAGETIESPYFSKRMSVFSGRDPSDARPAPSNATALWFRVLWLGLAGQVVWSVLALAGIFEGFYADMLRYSLVVLTALASHYDMEFLGQQVRWPWPRRWTIAFVVFPVNLIVMIGYVWFRRKRLAVAEESGDGGETVPKDARNSPSTGEASPVPRWSRPGWHYVIAGSVVGWVLILALDSISGLGPLALVWAGLPAAIILDTRQLSESSWTPKQIYWVIGGTIPFLNIVIAIVYLLRRYETTRQYNQ